MIFKIMSLFLVFMVILSIFGKFRFPGQARLEKAKCPKCLRFRIGKGPCPCEKTKS